MLHSSGPPNLWYMKTFTNSKAVSVFYQKLDHLGGEPTFDNVSSVVQEMVISKLAESQFEPVDDMFVRA